MCERDDATNKCFKDTTETCGRNPICGNCFHETWILTTTHAKHSCESVRTVGWRRRQEKSIEFEN